MENFRNDEGKRFNKVFGKGCVNIRTFYEAKFDGALGKPNAKGWVQTLCPFHTDTKPSLSINLKTGNWKCFGACKKEGDMYAFEKELGELNGQSAERTGLKRTAIEYNKGGKLVDVYDYKDEQGEVVYQVRRYEDKKFAVFTRKDGEWIPGLEEALRVPYHLPELSKANKIYICEGEKDADNVAELIVMSMGYASWYRLKSWWRIHESGVRSPRGVGLRFNRFLYT